MLRNLLIGTSVVMMIFMQQSQISLTRNLNQAFRKIPANTRQYHIKEP